MSCATLSPNQKFALKAKLVQNPLLSTLVPSMRGLMAAELVEIIDKTIRSTNT